MSMVEPRPNPETVIALLDTTWRMTEAESGRTEALDRKAATVATFASLVAGLTASLGIRFVERFDAWWAVAFFIAGLTALIAAMGTAVWTLLPREYVSLGIAYLERFPTWAEMHKRPEEVRGATMRGLIETIARERESNDRKAELIRSSLVLLLAGLVLIASEAATLAIEEVRQ